MNTIPFGVQSRMFRDTLSANLTALRNEMKKTKLGPIHAYLIPSSDPHLSEYVSDRDKRIQWISGFSGSAGLAIVGEEKAWLYTDGRYWNQASKELGSGWELIKDGLPSTVHPAKFLSQTLAPGSNCAVDPRLLNISAVKRYQNEFQQSKINFNFIDQNLIDLVWTNKAPLTESECILLGNDVVGRTIAEKLEWLREELKKNSASYIVITALDQIAWLLNFRGITDIPYNPVTISYLVVSTTGATLFISKSKLDENTRKEFENNHIIIDEYNAFDNYMLKLKEDSQKVWIDPNGPFNVYHVFSDNLDQILLKDSPVTLEKALKNPTELDGIRKSSLLDASALVKYFAWLENEVKSGKTNLNEYDASVELLKFRSKVKGFIAPSFETISSSGPNAAIIHYKPDETNSAKITSDQIYLCDSGGQYLNATTDVTRTFHFGTPTEKEKLCYTLVLKGVIALTTAIFPNAVTGLQIDAFARQALWKYGLNYSHGTGHGIGHFLNVHEGPHQISFRPLAGENALRANMLVSNEPGYYEDGKFGIRIENMMLIKNANTPNNFMNIGYLQFETLTFVPLDKNLIDVSLLNEEELQWVNNYHKECRDRISPLIEEKEVLSWLENRTQALTQNTK